MDPRRLQSIPRVIILSAPSGAGKTTIRNELFKRIPQLAFSVSATTRPRRANETDGMDYYFMTLEEFERRKAAEEFIEWEEVYPGRYYGTLFTEIERIAAQHRSPIFEVDVNGAFRLKRRVKESGLSIFVKPPSLEALAERLRGRGSESEADIQNRLAKAEYELAQAPHFDAVVLNDDLTAAIEQITVLINDFLTK